MCASVKNRAGRSRRARAIRKAILDPLEQNLRNGGAGPLMPVDFLRDIPLVEDFPDPSSGAWTIDTKPITENEVLVGGEEIHRGRTGTVIGHLVLLCRKGRIARMATTMSEGRLAAPRCRGAL
jgi:hypothetical protein